MFVPIQARHKVGDEVWVKNKDKSKLQPKKLGPTIILKVNNNTYLVKGLSKRKQDKVLHHNWLLHFKAHQKQFETFIPETKQQLVQYSVQTPDNPPYDLPPEEAKLQPGGC